MDGKGQEAEQKPDADEYRQRRLGQEHPVVHLEEDEEAERYTQDADQGAAGAFERPPTGRRRGRISRGLKRLVCSVQPASSGQTPISR